ncbi:unnamed protein product [Effrenium voratum]|uniref:Uncharacterized protein n=1 Tax=Effrenium voratum TaxID=2562239 RepID=A0AA36MTR3_9DINO|nr:unnamed protein product [Effrenium voratum]CAJ1413352.1 unnamed protein product [Effrenium voratum]
MAVEVRSRALWLVALLLMQTCCLVSGQARFCPNLQPYVQWLGRWKAACQPQNNVSWFASCSWITCECLWEALAAPVAQDELAPCFQEALVQSLLEQDVKWFVTSLLRTCRPHTDELSKPCGKCDKYREFNDCDGASSPFP